MAERLTGWPEPEAKGKSLDEVYRIVKEESRTPAQNPVQRVLAEGVVVGLANHTVLISRDGTERHIADSGSPIRSKDGSILGVVLVFRDQTEEKAAAELLKESEARYKSLFENMGSAVAVYKAEQNGEDFILVDFNAAGEKIEKIDRREVIGHNVLKVFPGVKEFGLFDVLQRVWRTGNPSTILSPCTKMTGRRVGETLSYISCLQVKSWRFTLMKPVELELRRLQETLREDWSLR